MSLLSENVKILKAIDATEGLAAATALNGAEVDTTGYRGCMMVVTFGAIVATAVTSIKAQQDTVTGMGSAADLAGTAQTVADTADGKTFVIDVELPREPFLRVVVSRGTANATVSAIYILYRGRRRPPAVVADGGIERFVSPAEGTA